ncbi:MAG: hypothetical protein K8L99_17945 [Anaerolineae bacterium]|nr:hypothetical protein [Anaerolineae bacterium]
MGEYTEEQLDKLADVTEAVLVGAVLSDISGPIATVKEFMAGSNVISEARQHYPNNKLIQRVPEQIAEINIDQGNEEELAQFRSQIARTIDEGLALIWDDAEGREYAAFLVAVAEGVIESAGLGLFGGGEKVSRGEAQFLQVLKERLGMA